MNLRKAADMAYPIDFGLLPDDVEAILGYVGGDTPYVWTPLESEDAQRSGGGRQWWPIVTLPERALRTQDGWRCAAVMLAALPEHGVSKTAPVFIDCEHDAWVANPAGAQAAIDGWKAQMRAGGYPNTFAYVPLVAGFDWVANWTNVEPSHLPAGWIGEQYGGNSAGGAYDLSAFDSALWDMAHGATVTPGDPAGPAAGETEEDDMKLFYVTSDDGHQYIVPADLSHKRLVLDPVNGTALEASAAYTPLRLTAAELATIPDATAAS